MEPDGINSTITGLDGSSPLTGNIVIGEADEARSGKPGFDDFANSAIHTDPFVVLGPGSPGLHPTEVAGYMIGSSTSLPGVAPAAHLYSRGFSQADDPSFDAVNLQSLATVSGMKAINISWNLGNESFETNGRSLLAQFVDWSAVRHDVLYVAAAGNYRPDLSDPNFDRSPADQYNGITVGALRLGSYGYNEFSDVNRDPDARDLNYYDRSYIDIMAPGGQAGAAIPVEGFNGTVDTVNSYGTSVAAPHVTGTIALLWQYRDQQTALNNSRFDSVHHYGMKAVILNSADKLLGVHGSSKTILNNHNQSYIQTPAFTDSAIALDPGMGVGALNARRSVEQFKSGKQFPGDPTPVPAIGWSEYFVGANDSQQYILPALGAGYIAITLCWDRITEHTGGNTYHYGDTFFPYAADYGPMNDLDLYLETQSGQVIDSSISSATNIEHIFFNLSGAGAYKIVVRNMGGLGNQNSQLYGLAWWWGNAAPPLRNPGDYDEDGDVDAADNVLWRKDPASFGGDPGGYDEWRANYGNVYSGSGSSLASVPEPSAICLALVGMLFCIAGRMKKPALGRLVTS
jgi:subtilisin family serine protease